MRKQKCREKQEKFERIVLFSPAYDKRSDNPKKDYGVGAVHIWFILKGRRGAVQVMFGTDWYLPSTIREYKERGNKNLPPPIILRKDDKFLTCWDVGYHSKKPMYEGQQKGECNILKGGHCYYDGSSLRGEHDRVADILLNEGSDGIWKYLEKEYKAIFKK